MVTGLNRALLVAAVLLGAAQQGPAADDGPEPDRASGRGLGRIAAIGETDSTVETRRGTTHTLLVDERTTFEDRDGTPRDFSDLETGMWVAGSYERTEDGRLVARLVILVGDRLPHVDRRAAGQVTTVDPGRATFSLHTRRGKDLTLSVTAETVFRSPDGSVSRLTDLKPGMVAAIAARRQDSALIAVTVIATIRPDRERATGEITTVRPDAGQFTLHTRDGVDPTFKVTDRTCFLSRDSSMNGIQDLRAGMHAAVVYVEQEQHTLVAVAVLVRDPRRQPRLDVRVSGRIVDVGSASFTLETRSGERLTFTVGEDTVFRSRQGDVQGVEDLEPGLLAAVGARQVEEGELRAVWVGVGPPPSGDRTD